MLKEFRDKISDGLDTKVFTTNFLPEAFSPDGQLDDPRRADITLGQLLCMTGGYTGEGGAPTAVVMGRAFPLKAVPGQSIRDLDASSLRCAMWTNAGAGYSLAGAAHRLDGSAAHHGNADAHGFAAAGAES